MDWLPWWVIEAVLLFSAFAGLYIAGTNGNLLAGVFAMTTIVATSVIVGYRAGVLSPT